MTTAGSVARGGSSSPTAASASSASGLRVLGLFGSLGAANGVGPNWCEPW